VPEGAHTCAQPLFCFRDLDINPMTLKLEGDLDILKMYLHTEDEVAMLRHSKLNKRWHVHSPWQMKKYENSSQSQRSRSNVTNLQSLLAFTTGHIPTKLNRFLFSSFRDFLRTDKHTDTQTPPKTACAQVVKSVKSARRRKWYDKSKNDLWRK